MRAATAMSLTRTTSMSKYAARPEQTPPMAFSSMSLYIFFFGGVVLSALSSLPLAPAPACCPPSEPPSPAVSSGSLTPSGIPSCSVIFWTRSMFTVLLPVPISFASSSAILSSRSLITSSFSYKRDEGLFCSLSSKCLRYCSILS